ncbi:hypothetical protein J7J47_08280 [Halomonas sp. ISL-60]|uniref:hypothetical protein n=1 Tax=unclassified Halomonas TaxID=2609666 RepID=UPI0007D9218B|nr:MULTISPECIES: hypothetical protein [unclassified Halomonas]MBT2772227.1 hypothetical protein [Halomonas sp. ISL-60]MBT2786408.1 hypothetical protein [Halomonas sp. ISL-106]MBT2797430.1 hypothetical protein [Halomonas sp. ISL-104]MBT2803014.1 hypothetical protein [Halomonas sp. ISL-56]OAL58794.1 hypothetical protein A6R74_07870 [Halomonas sp. ALS9]
MSSRLRNRHVWFGLLLGVLGLVYIASMEKSGLAELPHVLAALTVLIPLTMFGVVLRSPWPAAAALIMLVFINITLS